MEKIIITKTTTIDITPTWEALLPSLVYLAVNGTTAESRKTAMDELTRMARFADEPKDFDERGNRIHFRSDDGLEYWTEYDANNNEIHFRSHDISRGLGDEGEEWWKEYDENNNEIHFRNSDGREEWREYDKKGNKIAKPTP